MENHTEEQDIRITKVPSPTDLTTAGQIARNLDDAYDPSQYESWYRQMGYAFGSAFESLTSQPHTDGCFADFPPLKTDMIKVGQSRRILNSTFVDLSKIMYRDPSPEFPQVDKWTAEVRKQFFLERFRGDLHGGGSWSSHLAYGFMHGNGLGTGVLQLGLRKNPETGLQMVHLRHSPTIFTLWDPYEPTMDRANFVCFVRHLSVGDALKRFGTDILEFVDRTYEGSDGHAIETVRIFEYFDLGWAGGAPTMAVFARSWKLPPILHGKNVFGCLPAAHYEHFMAPGLARPLGRIPLQMGTQEALNDIERSLRQVLKRPTVDAIDPTQIDQKDLIDYNEGKTPVLSIKNARPGVQALQRTPGAEISQTAMLYMDKLERQHSSESGQNAYDQGNAPEKAMTKFEVGEYISRSAGQGGWSDKQAATMMVRVVEKALYIARKMDRDEIILDIFGTNVRLNVASDPRTLIAGWLEEPSRILVSEESMRHDDAERQRYQKLAELKELKTLVEMGFVDPAWWTEEMLKATGEQDPRVAMTAIALQGQADPQGAALGMASANPALGPSGADQVPTSAMAPQPA